MSRTTSPTINAQAIIEYGQQDHLEDAIRTFIDQRSTDDGGNRIISNPLWKIGRLGSGLLLTAAFISTPNVADVAPHGNEVRDVRPEQAPHLSAIYWLKEITNLSNERIAQLLGVSRAGLHAWMKNEPIRDTNRQRILAVVEILEQAAKKHRTPAEIVTWLDTPRGAEGRTPAQLLADGQLNRARLLAISSPSARLSRAPEWVRRPVPEAFKAGAEHFPEALPPSEDD